MGILKYKCLGGLILIGFLGAAYAGDNQYCRMLGPLWSDIEYRGSYDFVPFAYHYLEGSTFQGRCGYNTDYAKALTFDANTGINVYTYAQKQTQRGKYAVSYLYLNPKTARYRALRTVFYVKIGDVQYGRGSTYWSYPLF